MSIGNVHTSNRHHSTRNSLFTMWGSCHTSLSCLALTSHEDIPSDLPGCRLASASSIVLVAYILLTLSETSTFWNTGFSTNLSHYPSNFRLDCHRGLSESWVVPHEHDDGLVLIYSQFAILKHDGSYECIKTVCTWRYWIIKEWPLLCACATGILFYVYMLCESYILLLRHIISYLLNRISSSAISLANILVPIFAPRIFANWLATYVSRAIIYSSFYSPLL